MFNFKTSKLGRFLNQNMMEIAVAILIIAFIIFILQVLNNAAKKKRQQVVQKSHVVTDSSTETIISGSNVPEATNQENSKLIDSFIEYCNAKNLVAAYELLSRDCKEQLYQTIEDFKEYYYDKVFQSAKTYSMQSWISYSNQYTYKVKILDDMLATGQYSNSNMIEDYYTIVTEDGEERLSINSYIGKKEISIGKTENQIQVEILQKQVYMDYEVYTVQVTNNSDFTIALDSKESIRNCYLLGENSNEYSSYVDEVLTEDLIVNSGETKTVEIKFNKMYNPSAEILGIVFSDIIQDYETYVRANDSGKYLNRLSIQIEL